MICKNCGSNVAEGFTYCTNCGAQMPAAQQPAFDPYEDTGVLETEAPAPAPAPHTAPAVETPKPAYNAAPQKTAEDPGKGLGMAALILGIASIVMGSPVASVVGIILGSKAKKKSTEAGYENSLAKIGVILSIVGIVVSIVGIIAGSALGCFSGIMEGMASSYYY